MPKINILLFIKITYINLGPIIKSKAFINDNYRVLKIIFLEQLQLNYNNNFQDRLYLIYNDQKTAKLIYAYKREWTEAALLYNSYCQVLPVLGLQHFWLNFLYTIIRTFFSNKKYIQQYFTLYTYINHLRRQSIPIKRPPFYHLKELVLYSFNARIIALFLIYIRDRLNIYKKGIVKRYIRFLTPKQFLQYIKDIRATGFSSKVSREANKLVSLQPFACRGSQIID